MKFILAALLISNILGLELVSTIQLQENIRNTSVNVDYGNSVILDDYLYHLSTNPKLIMMYDLNTGKQHKQIGGVGDGPFEYRNPVDMVRVTDNNNQFGVLTPMGKFSLFDSGGDGVDEFWINEFAQSAIKKGNNLYTFANRHQSNKSILKIELTENGEKKVIGYSPSDDHWMQIEWSAGGIGATNDHLYYVFRTSPVIYSYNFTTSQIDSVKIESSNFKIAEVDFKFEDVQQDPMLVSDNLMSRSLTQGLHITDKYVIAGFKHFYNDNLPKEYFVLDHGLNSIGSFTWDEDHQTEYGSRIIATTEDFIYFYNEYVTPDGEIEKRLSKWKITYSN